MSITFPTVLLCDYVSKDVYNKDNAIGIYSGDIIVGDFPARMRLSLYVIGVAHEDGDHHIQLSFSLGGDEIAKAELDVKTTAEHGQSSFAIQNFELSVIENTELQIFAQVDNEKRSLLLAKKIYKAELNQPVTSSM